MAPLFTGFKFGFAGRGAPSNLKIAEYVYTGEQQTTLSVNSETRSIIFAGIGAGGDSVIAAAPNFGSGGGGGGAANLSGYTISFDPYVENTLYIGIGGPTNRRNTYVRTTSHTGTIIFELEQGSNGNSSGGGGAGGGSSLYAPVSGGNGGGGGARFNPGTTGAPATSAGAGGGGAGGYGDASPLVFGSPAGAGGNVTMSSPSYLQPFGFTPWTWGSSSSGGTGGSMPTPAGGGQAPASGALGGQGGDDNTRGSGGGGGAGIIFNGVSYGGGGGGDGWGPFETLIGKGSPGFLIVQLFS